LTPPGKCPKCPGEFFIQAGFSPTPPPPPRCIGVRAAAGAPLLNGALGRCRPARGFAENVLSTRPCCFSTDRPGPENRAAISPPRAHEYPFFVPNRPAPTAPQAPKIEKIKVGTTRGVANWYAGPLIWVPPSCPKNLALPALPVFFNPSSVLAAAQRVRRGVSFPPLVFHPPSKNPSPPPPARNSIPPRDFRKLPHPKQHFPGIGFFATHRGEPAPAGG